MLLSLLLALWSTRSSRNGIRGSNRGRFVIIEYIMSNPPACCKFRTIGIAIGIDMITIDNISICMSSQIDIRSTLSIDIRCVIAMKGIVCHGSTSIIIRWVHIISRACSRRIHFMTHALGVTATTAATSTATTTAAICLATNECTHWIRN